MTGGEALYADMGHFGARAVRIAWFGLVCPALMLNYFGQGALVLRDPAAHQEPVLPARPDSLLLALVVGNCGDCHRIAGNHLGAFSITQQASRLGYLPRIDVRHTSDRERGQIYVGSSTGSAARRVAAGA